MQIRRTFLKSAAGQPAPGEDMGAGTPPRPTSTPAQKHDRYIPGHSFGQYVSALSRKSAITGDPATRAKLIVIPEGNLRLQLPLP